MSTVLRASPPPRAARPIPRGRPVEGHAPSPHGFPVLRSISVYRHAVVNTPVARWVLIARGTAYSNRFPVPGGGGLPHIPARSATTLDFSRPAQRSLAITACRLAESPKRPVCLEGSDGFVTSTAAPIATGWSDPVAGWELHPLKTNTSRFTAHSMVSPELGALPPEARAVPLTNMAMVIPGSPSVSNREILECRRAWATQCLLSGPVSKTFPNRDSRQDRPLRLGYVSAYFARRNWMKPVWGLINHHDRERFEIHLFSDGPEPWIAEGYGRHSRDHLHETNGLSNEALAQLIEQVQIDLLVELNGYCKPPRLGLFALRAAPVQVAWFGMFATSGLRKLDYLVGDRHVIPDQEESFYTEQIVRVPGSYLTFEVGYPVPDVSPLPCLAAGFLTFGCLAPQYKITTEVNAAWSRIFSASPTSRLVLKNVVLEQPAARDFVRGQFARLSIAPIGWTSRARPSIIHSWSDTPASTSPWIRFPTMVERQPWKPSGKASRCFPLSVIVGPRGSVPRCFARRAWRNSSLRTLNITSRRPLPWPEILIPPTAFSSCALRCDRLRLAPLNEVTAFACNMANAYHAMWQRWCERKEP